MRTEQLKESRLRSRESGFKRWRSSILSTWGFGPSSETLTDWRLDLGGIRRGSIASGMWILRAQSTMTKALLPRRDRRLWICCHHSALPVVSSLHRRRLSQRSVMGNRFYQHRTVLLPLPSTSVISSSIRQFIRVSGHLSLHLYAQPSNLA
ncbi:hypothetical protein BDW66DRAFT_133765 [Aspergillus desertorum]